MPSNWKLPKEKMCNKFQKEGATFCTSVLLDQWMRHKFPGSQTKKGEIKSYILIFPTTKIFEQWQQNLGYDWKRSELYSFFPRRSKKKLWFSFSTGKPAPNLPTQNLSLSKYTHHFALISLRLVFVSASIGLEVNFSYDTEENQRK